MRQDGVIVFVYVFKGGKADLNKGVRNCHLRLRFEEGRKEDLDVCNMDRGNTALVSLASTHRQRDGSRLRRQRGLYSQAFCCLRF